MSSKLKVQAVWRITTDELCRIVHDAANSPMSNRAKGMMIDRTLRIISNIITNEDEDAGQNSLTARFGALYWSEKAYSKYQELIESGLTHRQACMAKDDNGKSIYINEHQYPINIAKQGVMFNEWSLDKLKKHMYNYGKFIVILKEQDKKIKVTTTTEIDIAEGRYDDAGINIRRIEWQK
jgi:hypothetical protein